MRPLKRLWSQVCLLWRRRAVRQEIDEELQFHVEQRMADNLAAGMTPEDAAREARKRFGNWQSVREDCREARGASFGETLWQDARFGARMLRKNPGFTAVAVISLALGIGANTAIFSLVNAIMLRSLPVPHPQELRVVQWSGLEPKTGMFTGSMREVGGDSGKRTDWLRVAGPAKRRTLADAFTYPQYRALREQCAAQADLFGYVELYEISVRGRGDPFVTRGIMVTGEFFFGLGVRPALGRLFSAADDQPGAAPSIVLTHALWERLFSLDPDVLGKALTLNGISYTVVGVVPRGFVGVGLSAGNEFYVPTSAQPHLAPGFPPTSSEHWWVNLMARLKPGVSDAQFQAALDVAFAAQVASVMKEPKIELLPGRAGPTNDQDFYRKPLMILLAVVGTVLLVACANLAGLSLARGAARQHELAVRAALGAGRWRLIRQSLTESLLLALLGGALGVLLAVWGKTAVSRLLTGSPEGLRYDLSLDLTVLGFTLATVLVTGLLSGLLPALRAGGVDPLAGLKSRAALGAPRLQVGRLLVAGQIALSTLLLAGAGLYVRTLVNLVQINPGFATEKLLLFKVVPGQEGYQGARLAAFYDSVQRSLAAIPGVRSAALSQYKLLGGMMSGGGFFSLPGHAFTGDLKPQAHRLTVSETFFTTMGIPLVTGRGFQAGDVEGAPRVVVVNRAFARTYLAGEHPIGQNLRAGEFNGKPIDWQIVGVCGDAKYTDLKREVPPTVYFSFRQDGAYGAYFAVRTALPPMALAAAARKAVAGIDPNVPLSDITSQEQVRNENISQERLFAMLCGALAGLAVLLSCVGLYGLMAYNVARWTSEIGIRMALGATRTQIASPIMGEAVRLSGAGVMIGVPVALALSRLIEHQLYGVTPSDPGTLACAAGALLVVAIIAAWVPARRAARVDPITALRCE